MPLIERLLMLGSIHPGKRSEDPVVNDLSALKFTTSGQVCYKLHFNAETEWADLPQWINIPNELFERIREFSTTFPISLKKHNPVHERCNGTVRAPIFLLFASNKL